MLRVRAKTIRAPLTIGFGVLLGLTVTATVLTLTKSFSIFESLTASHEKHDQVAEALQKLRADLYLAGIMKRDFLLERSAEKSALYREQFANLKASTDQNLSIIQMGLGKEQSRTVDQLRSEVTAYMRPLREALDWDLILAPSLRWYLLRAQLQQRTAALQIAGDIEKLNRDLLKAQQDRIELAERDFRRTVVAISVASVLIGIAVALSTIVYMRRLERNAEAARLDLKRLSTLR